MKVQLLFFLPFIFITCDSPPLGLKCLVAACELEKTMQHQEDRLSGEGTTTEHTKR